MSRLLTPGEVAARLGLSSPDSVYAHIAAGTLKASNVSSGRHPRYVIRESEFEDFIARREKQVRAVASRRRAKPIQEDEVWYV